MEDIFENTILCKNCKKEMVEETASRDGFVMRSVVCNICGNRIIHPQDLKDYEDYKNLRRKSFKVKLRFVGNSYAISIPREIINFMAEKEKEINDMVELYLEEFGRLSINF